MAQAIRDYQAASRQDGGRLWGRTLEGPMVLVDPGTRRAFASEQPPGDGFVRRNGLWEGTLPDGLPLANTAITWGERRWATVLLPIPSDRFLALQLLVHESFHRIQGELGLARGDQLNPHLDERDGRYWLRLELRALDAALRARGGARRQAVRDAMVFRQARLARYPGADTLENALEVAEGLPEYTGTRLALDYLGLPLERAAALGPDFERRKTFTRSLGYGTGPGLGLLLDQLRPDWRPRVAQEGFAPQLAAVVGVRPGTQGADDRLASRYDGKSLAIEEDRRNQERERRLADYRRRLIDGPVLLLQQNGLQRAFNPNELIPMGADGTIYPTGTFGAGWGSVEVNEGGALVSPDYNLLRLPGPVDTTGGTIRGPGWILKLSPGWRLMPGMRSGDLRVGKEESLRTVPAHDTLATLLATDSLLRRLGRRLAAPLWPGFRPDTIARRYEIPGRGTLLVNWPESLPAGYRPLPGAAGAAWADAEAAPEFDLPGSGAAHAAPQVGAQDLDPVRLLGEAAHETFHAYSFSARQEGRRFGRWENAAFTSRYPQLDERNEAGVRLEGRVLEAALEAGSDREARAQAARFLALRARRQQRIGSDAADFEERLELNEGLAEYVFVRAVLGAIRDTIWWAEAGEANLARHVARLDSLALSALRVPRRRGYYLGTGLGRLLDRLAGDGWREEMLADNLTLQGMLARLVPVSPSASARLIHEAERQFDAPGLRAEAAQLIATLRLERARLVDSLLSRPGVEFRLEGMESELAVCGFDPNRVLQAGGDLLIYPTFVGVCGDSTLRAQVSGPSVLDHSGGKIVVRAIVGPAGSLAITVGDAPVALASLASARALTDLRIQAPHLHLEAAAATVSYDGRVVRLMMGRKDG